MLDCIYHESMRQGITCSVSFYLFIYFFFGICLLSAFFFFLFFLRGDTSVFLRMKEMELLLS